VAAAVSGEAHGDGGAQPDGEVGPDGVLALGDPLALDRERVGSKAASLAALSQADLPVPEAYVLTVDLYLEAAGSESISPKLSGAASGPLRRAAVWLSDQFGTCPVAVRSSAADEDLPDASFAGLFESVLDVQGAAAIEIAVRRCWRSARSPEAEAYRERMGITSPPRMAVLVQRMVQPRASGVAFGADPVTGDRDTKLVTAVPGIGAELVDGTCTAEEWKVVDGRAFCHNDMGTLTETEVLSVASLLQRVQVERGGLLDMEWSLAGDVVHILQARPITSLPERPIWSTPHAGLWLRNIRLGEWLPEPVTPLFDTWLLAKVDDSFVAYQEAAAGFRASGPLHVLAEGWYFHSPTGSGGSSLLVKGLLKRPRFAVAVLSAAFRPDWADRLGYAGTGAHWRNVLLPRYRAQVAEACTHVRTSSPSDLEKLVDEIAETVGELYWSFVVLGGAAWRAEAALEKFFRKHLPSALPSVQLLLSGLAETGVQEHAVTSLDWFRPTLGELGGSLLAGSVHGGGGFADVADRAERPYGAVNSEVASKRRAAESQCFQALAGDARRLLRLRRLLRVAQRYAVQRDEHSVWFTLAWPLLRTAVLRLGGTLVDESVLRRADDVFFLTRAELTTNLQDSRGHDLTELAEGRRREWDRQRRLTPPPAIGESAFILSKLLRASSVADNPRAASDSVLTGTPVSPGRATGRVRVLRDPTQIGQVQAGEVLVVSAAVPALTVLFDRIAGLCVAGGSVAAHASLVAREFGLPAVVGLGTSVKRLRNGDVVTVDGTAGVVERTATSA
jgi:rifampicin phosphotransferase